jgi:hypothetical protein
LEDFPNKIGRQSDQICWGNPARDAVRVTDWVDWHRAYGDPASSLARRLAVVRRFVAEALELVRAPQPRVLGLCAGDGRDVIPVVADMNASERPSVVLVEQDAALARRAVDAAAAARLDSVEVRIGDASDPRTFEDVTPVDLLLLCGILGNITDEDVRHLIAVVPRFLCPAGCVIWTRGASDPDARPQVRAWFRSAGFEELAFDDAPELFGVGLSRLSNTPDARAAPPPRTPLFTFVR